LRVDQHARFGLVEMHGRSGRVRRDDQFGHRALGRRRLLSEQPLFQRELRRVGLLCHLFPEGALVGRGAEFGFQGFQASDRLVMGGLMLGQRGRQAFQLDPQRFALIGGRHRRPERTGLEPWILECAVEPDRKLPDDLQPGERHRMIAGHPVAGSVTGASDFLEQLADLARQDAAVLKPTKQIELRLVRRLVGPHLDRDQPCQ